MKKIGRFISIKNNKLNDENDFYDIYRDMWVTFKGGHNNILVNPNNVVVKEHHNNKYYLPIYDVNYQFFDKKNLDIIINLDKDNKLYHEKIYNPIAQKNKTIIDQQFYKNLFKDQNNFKDNIKKDIKINYDIGTTLNITNFEGNNLELPEFTNDLNVFYKKESNNKKFNIIVPKGDVILNSDTIDNWSNTKPKYLPVKLDIGIIDCSSIDLSFLDLDIFKITIDKLIIRDSRQSLSFPSNSLDKYKIHIKELQILANEFISEEIRYMTVDKITGNTEYLLNTKIKGVKHPNLFKNKTFCVIGTFRWLTKYSVEKRIEEAKGKINNKIDNSVDYLVCGSKGNIEGSSKYLEAKRSGIKIINEKQVHNWFKGAGVY